MELIKTVHWCAGCGVFSLCLCMLLVCGESNIGVCVCLCTVFVCVFLQSFMCIKKVDASDFYMGAPMSSRACV